MPQIESSNISVVVQGPIHTQDSLTKRVLESVRTHLPDAELILSTWKGCNVEGLDCDILLLNDDPGAINGRNNVNRQIVSTRNGLQKATRTYAMKLRTDTLLTGTGFIDAFEKYPERSDELKVFARKLVIPTHFTRNPTSFYVHSWTPYFFHPSDIFQFGLKEDLLILWNIPLVNSQINCSTEVYIWTKCLQIYSKNIDYLSLPVFDRLKLSEKSIVNNYNVELPNILGIKLPSHFFEKAYSCYQPMDIEKLYARYVINRKNSAAFSSIFRMLLFLPFSSGLTLNIGFRRYLGSIFFPKE